MRSAGAAPAAQRGGAGLERLPAGLDRAAALFAFYFLLALVYPAGMGFGDVKLAGVLGLFLGWLGWGELAVGAFLGFLIGAVAGIGLIVAGRAGRKTAIPFGPYMLAGALIAVLVGGAVADAYFQTCCAG